MSYKKNYENDYFSLKNKIVFFLKRLRNNFIRLLRLFQYLVIEPKFVIIITKVIYEYLKSVLVTNRLAGKKFSSEKKDFISLCADNLNFDQRDLFSNNVTSWLYIFNKYSLINESMNTLEVGSYEGRSSVFLLKTLNNINLTCVDTFEPFHELQEKNNEKLTKIYENFLKNISDYSERVNVEKKKSDIFFSNNTKKFKLIFIDGSHEFNDVKNDASEAFKILEKGGIIIFDDFLWHHKQSPKLSITYAILKFLDENKSKLKIIYVNYQLMIQKI